jgi:hypothetical protein
MSQVAAREQVGGRLRRSVQEPGVRQKEAEPNEHRQMSRTTSHSVVH